MNKKKLVSGVLLLFAGLALDWFLPLVLFTLIAPLSMGGMTGMFVIRLITLVAVVMVFVKGGRYIIQSADKSKVRSERAKAVLVGGLLIFTIFRLLSLLTMVSYELSYILSGYIVPITRYFIPHILALGMVVIALLILTRKHTKEEAEEEERIANQPVPYSKFTYIGGAIVSLPFLVASLLLFEELYFFSDEYFLPKNPLSSNLFWGLLIVLFLINLFTNGLEFYTVKYRDSSGKKVSSIQAGERVLGDQIGALAKTFLMPLFIAGFLALIPYYILYFTISFFLINAFTIALLILLILLVLGSLFVFSRKNKNKTGEVLWLVSWFFLGLLALFILYLFL